MGSMVSKMILQEKKVYRCDSCDMLYKDKKTAEKCEAWCSKHHSCNLAVINHSLNNKGDKK